MTAARKMAPRSVDTVATVATVADLRLLQAEIHDLATRTPKPPPPHDLDDERVVLVALLEGRADLVDVADLDPRDMYADSHAELLAVLVAALEIGHRCSVGTAAELLRRAGYRGDVHTGLVDLVATTEAAIGVRVRRFVDRVRRLARARRALDATLRADECLRLGRDDEAAEWLRRALQEVSS